MEEKNVKVSLLTVILTIFVIIIAVSLVIIATILIINKKEEKQLQQNETQNSIALQQNTSQLEKKNSKEEMNVENNKNNNQTFDFEFNQYTEINLNDKKKVVKLKQIKTITSDNEEQNYSRKIQIAIDDSSYKELYETYDDSLPRIEKIKDKDEKDYIAIINNYNWTNNYIKIFDENCNFIGEVKYLGGTSFIVENDIKPNYELELNSIYVYNFISEGKFALYEYTIENNKIVENIIETYQDDIESGTYISGRS